MKKVIFLVVCFMLLSSIVYAGQVRSYTRSDGTYVQSYQRSSPNSTVRDNWSYEGQTNPVTGREGHDHYRSNPTSEYYGTSGRSSSSWEY